jgi:hypothetical protein
MHQIFNHFSPLEIKVIAEEMTVNTIINIRNHQPAGGKGIVSLQKRGRFLGMRSRWFTSQAGVFTCT